MFPQSCVCRPDLILNPGSPRFTHQLDVVLESLHDCIFGGQPNEFSMPEECAGLRMLVKSSICRTVDVCSYDDSAPTSKHQCSSWMYRIARAGKWNPLFLLVPFDEPGQFRCDRLLNRPKNFASLTTISRLSGMV